MVNGATTTTTVATTRSPSDTMTMMEMRVKIITSTSLILGNHTSSHPTIRAKRTIIEATTTTVITTLSSSTSSKVSTRVDAPRIPSQTNLRILPMVIKAVLKISSTISHTIRNNLANLTKLVLLQICHSKMHLTKGQMASRIPLQDSRLKDSQANLRLARLQLVHSRDHLSLKASLVLKPGATISPQWCLVIRCSRSIFCPTSTS